MAATGEHDGVMMMKDMPTDLEMAILMLLLSGREMYGLEMVRKDPDVILESSVYVVLTRMVARGFVKARYETDAEKKTRGPRRRLYKITPFGEQQYDARLAAERSAAKVIAKGGQMKPEGAM